MSWNASLNAAYKYDIKKALELPILQIPFDFKSFGDADGPILDQISAARDAALELLKGISGPKVGVNLSGHANGVGWHKKEGWANDTITVTVSQLVD